MLRITDRKEFESLLELLKSCSAGAEEFPAELFKSGGVFILKWCDGGWCDCKRRQPEPVADQSA